MSVEKSSANRCGVGCCSCVEVVSKDDTLYFFDTKDEDRRTGAFVVDRQRFSEYVGALRQGVEVGTLFTNATGEVVARDFYDEEELAAFGEYALAGCFDAENMHDLEPVIARTDRATPPQPLAA